MKKLTVLLVLALVLIFPITASADSGTQVYQFRDEPFDYWQCYQTTGFFPGPAATLGEDVCVNYVASNDSTVRMKANGDVEWTLTQHGTAYIYKSDMTTLLDTGVFSVQEVARDDGGDAGCVWTDGQHAWLGICSGFFTNLDYAKYHWKIDGNSTYFFDGTIHGAGNWCYSSKQGGSMGPGCK